MLQHAISLTDFDQFQMSPQVMNYTNECDSYLLNVLGLT